MQERERLRKDRRIMAFAAWLCAIMYTSNRGTKQTGKLEQRELEDVRSDDGANDEDDKKGGRQKDSDPRIGGRCQIPKPSDCCSERRHSQTRKA